MMKSASCIVVKDAFIGRLMERDMNDEQQNQIIAEARAHWDAGVPIHAGIAIFERIPLDDRPSWAADLLESVYQYVPPIAEVTTVLEFARHPENWPESRRYEAHNIVSDVKHPYSVTSDTTLADQICALAEDVAGVTYTARQYPAPFDHHRGWRTVERFYALTKTLSLNEDHMWPIVANKHYILLDAPIRCHPGCPTCYTPRWDYGFLYRKS